MKAAAKEALGGKIFGQSWMMALLVLLLVTVIGAAAATVVPGIGGVLVTGPLAGGAVFAFLRLRREGTMEVGDMFEGFRRDFGGYFLLGLLTGIFVFLWSLLFVIPGIVKSYAWSMVYFVKNDHPELGWRECMKESARMMKGHKWQLFVLDLSFIGWYIVGSLCLGVGTLWVTPYAFAAKAEFYEDLKRL